MNGMQFTRNKGNCVCGCVFGKVFGLMEIGGLVLFKDSLELSVALGSRTLSMSLYFVFRCS